MSNDENNFDIKVFCFCKYKSSRPLKEVDFYESKSKSLSNSQVLFRDYTRPEALTVLKEMVDGLVTEMVAQGLYTDHVSIYVGYSGWTSPETGGGRKIEGGHTDSYKRIVEVVESLYQKTTRYYEPIRSLGISFGNLTYECCKTLSLFDDLSDLYIISTVFIVSG